MRAAAALIVLCVAAPAAALDVPPLTGRVVDLADVLDSATEATLTDRLAAHEDTTSDQVVVLTISSLDGEDLEAYATRVFRAWGLGQGETNNGVLLLVAVADRKLRIEVGYGLEGALTDATAGTIIRSEIVPRFREGDLDAGVLAGVDAILLAVAGEYRVDERTSEGDLAGLVVLCALLVPVVAIPALVHGGLDGAGLTRATLGGLAAGGSVALPATVLSGSRWGGLVGAVSVLGLFLLVNLLVERHPRLGPKRAHFRRKQEAFKRARTRGATTVRVDGRSYAVPTGTSSGGSFSGGGGSSGGGGASGSW